MSQLYMYRASLSSLPGMPLIDHGYVLRSCEAQDEEGLAALLARAFEDAEWTAARVQRDLTAAPDVRRTFLVAYDSTPVATASVQVVQVDGSEHGYVHWVGAHPEHAGRRLGYIVTLAVLREMSTLGFADATLITDDHRLAAIKVYRQLGFEPFHKDETHPARWEAIEAQLRGMHHAARYAVK